LAPIKIAFLIDSITSHKAGTEKQLLEIAGRLDRARFEPLIICLSSSSWLERHCLPCRSFVLGYHGFFKPGFPSVLMRLSRIIRDEQIDILQTFFEDSIFVAFLATRLSSKRPTLLSSRRDMGLGHDDLWYHSLYKAVLPLVNRSFHSIVANGDMVKAYVAEREKTSQAKIKVIPNGILLPPEYTDKPSVFTDISAELWIGAVGNLKQVKRMDVFLGGLAVLSRRSRINYHAVILGEGPEESKLRNMADELGIAHRVHFMGAVEDVYAYMLNLDIGVLCSDKEGFSNAIMEYMACGLPVIATAVGGNVELVDASNGVLIPPGNSEALGEALFELAENASLRESKASVSRQRIVERYSWSKTMAEWEEFYLSLLG